MGSRDPRPDIHDATRAGGVRSRCFASSAAKRSRLLPDVPTIDESGYKGVVLEAWYGAFVPAGTPAADRRAPQREEMNKALEDPKLIGTFDKGAIEPVGGNSEDLEQVGEIRPRRNMRALQEINLVTN